VFIPVFLADSVLKMDNKIVRDVQVNFMGALQVLARGRDTRREDERDSVWSASGLPALWIGNVRGAVICEGR
jgi:hypothetical protein